MCSSNMKYVIQGGLVMDENRLVPPVGGKESGYLFEFKSEGVFLTVYPSADSGILFELSDMFKILQEHSVVDYKIETLTKVVREADGKPQKVADGFGNVVMDDAAENNSIAEEDPSEPKKMEYAKVKLDISKNRMDVRVHVDMKDGLQKPTEDIVLNALQEKNIVFGIDNEAIKAGLEDGIDFVAAKGIQPIKGEDARIEKKIDFGEKGRPVANDLDQVDYKNLNLFVLVKKGDLLAERIPHTHGTVGKNIFGKEVAAKPGKPKPLPNGKNTVVVEENKIVADIDGQVIDAGNKLSIDPQLQISGDVDMSTGNIDFTGIIQIRGSVQAGFTVKATGDIEINGMVSGGMVEGRNIFIKGGVQGMNRGGLKAEEDIRASYAENAQITAGGIIVISDVVLHSELRAGKKIIIEEKRGQVTGGSLVAGEFIRLKTAGNLMNVSTRLEVGVNPTLRIKYQEVCEELMNAKKRLSQLNKTLNTLGKIDISKLPQDKIDKIGELTRSQFPLAGMIERDEKLLQELETEMRSMKKGKIYIAGIAYPGVKIIVNSVIKNLQSEEQHCSFYLDDESIRLGAY